jgi:hypothetical protein
MVSDWLAGSGKVEIDWQLRLAWVRLASSPAERERREAVLEFVAGV